MSKIVKSVTGAVGGAFKAVGKVVKKVVSGVTKVFKKVWESPLGKIALIAAAIYTGGVALGAFNGPLAVMQGGGLMASQGSAISTAIAAPAASAGAGAGAGINTAALQAAAAGQVGGSVAGASTAIPGATVAGAGASGGMNAALLQAGSNAAFNASVPAAQTAAAGAAGAGGAGVSAAAPAMTKAQGIVNSIRAMGKSAATWAADNPLVAAMGVNAAANALTPTPAEEAEEAKKNYWQNLHVGNIDLGMNAKNGVARLKDMEGNNVWGPDGLITSRMQQPSQVA